MVKNLSLRSLFFVFILKGNFLWGIGASVSAEIDTKQAFANNPVPLTLTIQHDQKEVIDESSFKLNGAKIVPPPLKIKELPLSGKSVELLSFYKLSLPAQPEGIYLLPQITVKVGSAVLSPLRMTYQVVAGQNKPVTTSTKIEPLLQVESILEFASPLYPGQTGNVGYRYYFNYDMDLKKEVLPLLEATGFKKLGGKIANTTVREDGVTVFQVMQKIQAERPGEYFFLGAHVEGAPYTLNSKKEKVFLPTPLTADTAESKIVVAAFPSNPPPFFQGALGQFTINALLLSQDNIATGDPLYLAVDIQGLGETQELLPPALLSYPGFKGFFDYLKPPEEKQLQEEGLRFLYTLTPKTTAVNSIPPIPFSFFDPLAGSYNTVYSQAISITVNGSEGGLQNIIAPKGFPEEQTAPELIEIQAKNAFSSFDVRSLPLGGINTLLILPFGAFFLFLLFSYKRHDTLLKKWESGESYRLLQDALLLSGDDPLFNPLVKKAFISLWYQQGKISEKSLLFEELPEALSKEKGEVLEVLKTPNDKKKVKNLFEESIRT